MKIRFAGSDLLTGLPEYRNGGLLVDTGLLTLKERDAKRGIAAYKDNATVKGQPNMEVVPLFSTDDDVVVEWRAVTVGFLDDLLIEVNGVLGLSGAGKLSLAQMLEAGSWKVNPHTRYEDEHILIRLCAGWKRAGRSFEAEHQRASYYDNVRRHSLLRSGVHLSILHFLPTV